MNSEELAGTHGLEPVINLTGTRYLYCTADYAELCSIEGDTAIYRGNCNGRHEYKVEVKRESLVVENGELKIGSKESGFTALGEY